MKKVIMFFTLLMTLCMLQSQNLPSEGETIEVFDFIFGDGSGSKITGITNNDKQKAKFFIYEMVEKSCAMSFTETLTKSALRPGSSIESIIRNLVINTYNNCNSDTKEGKIYDSVRNTLNRNWKSAFEIRVQTGEW